MEEVRPEGKARVTAGFVAGMESWKTMEERDFFNETTEQRSHTLTCPKCGQAGEYKVTLGGAAQAGATAPRGRRAGPRQVRQGAVLHGKTR